MFNPPLKKDPSIALPDPKITPKVTPGPVRKQQFVVELVGPRTVTAASVKALLSPQWQNTLGTPEIYVMAGADQFWRQLEPQDTSGAYDSIALAWNLLSEHGTLSPTSAQHLWNVCEDLAKQLGRRALAMPVPEDVEPTISVLEELKDSLDIGVNFAVLSRGPGFPEQYIWRVAAELGLDYGTNGSFQWLAPGVELPLFEVTPAGDLDRFALSQVEAGFNHPGLGLGFSVPLCPDPELALNGCLKAGEVFATRLDGAFVDDEENPVTDRTAKGLRRDLKQAISALDRAGFQPGSTEAVKLFG